MDFDDWSIDKGGVVLINSEELDEDCEVVWGLFYNASDQDVKSLADI